MKNLIRRFIREDGGQDLVEYALLLTLIALALVAAVTGLTGAISGQFSRVDRILRTGA
jgi:pilus assembly protein Flp/PilA